MLSNEPESGYLPHSAPWAKVFTGIALRSPYRLQGAGNSTTAEQLSTDVTVFCRLHIAVGRPATGAETLGNCVAGDYGVVAPPQSIASFDRCKPTSMIGVRDIRKVGSA